MVDSDEPRSLQKARADHEQLQAEGTRVRRMDEVARYAYFRIPRPARLGGAGNCIVDLPSDPTRNQREFALGRWLAELAEALPASALAPHRKEAERRFTVKTHPDALVRDIEREEWIIDAALAAILDEVSRGSGGRLSRRLNEFTDGKLRVTPEIVAAARSRKEPRYVNHHWVRPTVTSSHWWRQHKELLDAIPDEVLDKLVSIADSHQHALDSALGEKLKTRYDEWREAMDHKEEQAVDRLHEEERFLWETRSAHTRPAPAPAPSASYSPPVTGPTTTPRPVTVPRWSADPADWPDVRRTADELGSERDIDLASEPGAQSGARPVTSAVQSSAPVAGALTATAGPIQEWFTAFVADHPELHGLTDDALDAAAAVALNVGRENAAELDGVEPVSPSDMRSARTGDLDQTWADVVGEPRDPAERLQLRMQEATIRVTTHARAVAGLVPGAQPHADLIAHAQQVAVTQFGIAINDGTETTVIPSGSQVPLRLVVTPEVLDQIADTAFGVAADAGRPWATPANLGIVDRQAVWESALAELGFAPAATEGPTVVLTNETPAR